MTDDTKPVSDPGPGIEAMVEAVAFAAFEQGCANAGPNREYAEAKARKETARSALISAIRSLAAERDEARSEAVLYKGSHESCVIAHTTVCKERDEARAAANENHAAYTLAFQRVQALEAAAGESLGLRERVEALAKAEEGRATEAARQSARATDLGRRHEADRLDDRSYHHAAHAKDLRTALASTDHAGKEG